MNKIECKIEHERINSLMLVTTAESNNFASRNPE